ncbi:MAG: FKBP-type peptidyl-prolyl cis-trans isomerase FkpA [Sphingomonadales bacterium]|jgi:FKBP-type peptidyl-prolyl cis-trans isomerase|nr:FKBP-type peptidyl-prolyl cis-trans isomerase FkpA [Sphingomonadales bacterium]
MILLAFLLAATSPSAVRPASPRGVEVTASGLRIRAVKPGTGPAPGPDDAVQIDYVGRLANGKVFDHAKGAGMLVSGTVPGFAEALQHMRKGGTYRVWIPPQLAYGAEGAGGGIIPPGATLDFTITVRDVGHPVAAPVQ